MTLRAFTHCDLIDRRDPALIAARRRQIAREMERVAKASESSLPDTHRRQVLIVQSGQLEHTYRPRKWDKAKWFAGFILTGLALGAVIVAVIDWHMR